MARSLIESFSRPNDLIADPFCGCGVVPLEAVAAQRHVIAGDWNPYAVTLTRAKLFAPATLADAQTRFECVWNTSRTKLATEELEMVPSWVKQFFHPETLRSALAFRDACICHNDFFLLACLLGILHHQRPGFLSYPSSHLVPYLRDKKFPRTEYPQMYEERDVYKRMEAKLRRTYRRFPVLSNSERRVVHADARRFPTKDNIQAVITSPPYMNELDYVRDNRLRLWFINRSLPAGIELAGRNRERAYISLIRTVCKRLAKHIRRNGYFILVVGEATRGLGHAGNTKRLTRTAFELESVLQQFECTQMFYDRIPDIRRARREYRGTKGETLMVFRKRC